MTTAHSPVQELVTTNQEAHKAVWAKMKAREPVSLDDISSLFITNIPEDTSCVARATKASMAYFHDDLSKALSLYEELFPSNRLILDYINKRVEFYAPATAPSWDGSVHDCGGYDLLFAVPAKEQNISQAVVEGIVKALAENRIN